jgi:RND family efflux transporter MFP subunit
MKILNKLKLTKKRIIILIILAVIIGIFFVFRSKNQTEPESAVVKRGTVKEELILSGSVKAEKHALLSFPSSGKISWVGVSEGQAVTKSQALISLDRVVLAAAYQQALNNYKNYQAAADNTLDTLQGNTGDESYSQRATRTAAEVARDNAYDALKAAKYNLDNATIYAPFPGIVTYLPYKNPGVNISLTDRVVEIVDPETIYFELNADQSDVIKISMGMDVEIVLDSYDEKVLTGKVVYVSLTPKSGEIETVYVVKILMDKFDDKLARVGMTGDAKLILSKKDNVPYVPIDFINSDKEGQFVNSGKPGNKVYVETGIESEDFVEILNGINEGETVYD